MHRQLSFLTKFPDAEGYYGKFGGNYYPLEVRPALEELASIYLSVRDDPNFQLALEKARTGLQGRPTPVHFLENITGKIGGARIYAKREDLNQHRCP